MNLIVTDAPAKKFSDPAFTLDGQARAHVTSRGLSTIWFNTGTLCNLTCESCYIESSPSNDRLVYLSHAEVQTYLDEVERDHPSVNQIGLTGGEPFMNPDVIDIMALCLSRGFNLIVLTNAMRPMMKCAEELAALQAQFPEQLTMRVSIDHYTRELHEVERGRRSWNPMIVGLEWLAKHGFNIDIAGRMRWTDDESSLRAGFAGLFREIGLDIDASCNDRLMLFPEMDPTADVPEITESCWATLNLDPASVMCADSRMIVKRKGAQAPEVVACTLLPYDEDFSLGRTLTDSIVPISLNHTNCAQFCVLGGGSCTA